MPSQILTCPIVGAYFRPPARVVLSHLPLGTPLELDPEPENEHDPNAIAVYVSMEQLAKIDWEPYNDELMSCGSSPAGLINEEYPDALHLGYIPRTHNVAFLGALAASPSHRATLAALPDGKPAVRLELPE